MSLVAGAFFALIARQAAVEEPVEIEDALCSAVREAEYIYSAPTREPHRRASEVTERLIREVANECHQRQIALIVFNLSSSVQVYPDRGLRQRVAARCNIEHLFYSERRLESYCAQSQIALVPLASKLQRLADQSREYLHGFANARLGLGYWSKFGRSVAASIIADQLK